MTPAEITDHLESEAVRHIGRSRVEAVVAAATKVTGRSLWDALVAALGKRLDWHMVAMMEALRVAGFPEVLGRHPTLVESDVKTNVSPAQLAEAIGRVSAMSERERDRAAAFYAGEQASRNAERAVKKPSAPPKVEQPRQKRAYAGGGRCKMAGCGARGLARYDGYCFECYQDV